MAADTVTVIWLLRNQIQQSKSEDLLGFPHESAAVHLQLQGCSEGFYKLQDFYRKKGGAKELLAKEKKGLFLSWAIFSGGGEFLSCRLPLLPMRDGEGPQDRSPYWCWTRKFQTSRLILHFWKKLKMQLGQALNLFGMMGF